MNEFLMMFKKLIVKLVCLFIPSSRARKDFRHKFLLEEHVTPTTKSKYYGKIYMPYYPNCEFTKDLPNIYNKDGRPMELFFIRDKIGAHCPYIDSSKYFLWDRFNIGLDTHFYTHGTILETMGNPKHRYGYFIESESIIPREYAIFEKHKGIEKDFDAIFTYSEKLLDTLDNAKFFPSCASMWYGKEIFNGKKDSTTLDSKIYLSKTKNISMICSAQYTTEMHRFRHAVANSALATGKVDLFGGFRIGGCFDYKSKTLKDYRFQIVVENDIKPYYFTEKIIDCFASMTIPVYIGATKIDDFFDPNGIIKFSKKDDIEKIIAQCTPQEYEFRLKAVIENYNRCLKFANINDLLYEEYFQKEVANV